MRRGCRERFPRPPRVIDPDMHHGTCVKHVPWCMSGSITSGFVWSRWWGKRSRHSRRMRNPQFYISGKRPMKWSVVCPSIHLFNQLARQALGWGLLSQFPPFHYFPNFSALSKHTLDIEYHVYIWQVATQPSCGDTCQIWMWFNQSKKVLLQGQKFSLWGN